jgi:predicted DNA-binding transcriptional regulator YafY
VSWTATRVLALLEVLQDRGLVPAAELAERLEVEPRSVRRYVTAVRDMGIPIESVRGRHGGYRLAPGARTPPLVLGDDEAVAVAVALTGPGGGDAVGEPSAADRALVKLTRLLPLALRERVRALVAATDVLADGRADTSPDPELALTLAGAVRDHRRVRIDHTRQDGRSQVRDVDPYGLVVHARRWYLVGHDHRSGELRTFRVDRIASAAVLANRFAPPVGLDVVDHVRHGLTLGAWTHRTEVWLDTDAATARARLPTTVGELHPCPGGGVLLVSGAEDLDGMARMLTSLPWAFAVRSPAALADALAAHVDRLAGAVARSRA